MKLRLAAVLLGLTFWAGSLAAQTVPKNPTAMAWDHDDFATAESYQGAYYQLLVLADNTCDVKSPAATVATKTDNLGKPATTTGLGMSALLIAKPIGCYIYKVRALDVSGLWSAWSDPSGPFEKDPAAPRNLVAK